MKLADEPLLTVEDIAGLLNVRRRFVYEKAADGTIPSLLVGRYRRFERQAVEEWLEAQRCGSEVNGRSP